MIRKRNPEAVKRSVKSAINILEEVQSKFNIPSKHLLRNKVHKTKGNKYFKMFKRIIDYLEESRDNYNNPLKNMLEDYYTCICEHFTRFDRHPRTINFSPSANNKIMFIEWTDKFEHDNQESYWISYKIKPEIEFTEVELEIIENCEIAEV